MVLIVFMTMMNFTIAKGTMVAHGTNLSEAISQLDTSVSGKAATGDFKPPKSSFVDYDTFFSCSVFIPLNQHGVSPPFADIKFRAVPGIWPDIPVPPKI